jgi:hypothetical protein
MALRKRALTLLEVVISIVLLGALLTGLFNSFRQGSRKAIQAKELKQKVFQLELFQQKMKTLLSCENGVWIDKHKGAAGMALCFGFEQRADPDFKMYGDLQGALFLNGNKELCLLTGVEGDKMITDVLLDGIDHFICALFDPKTKQWTQNYPKEKTESPIMVSIELKCKTQETLLVFFLHSHTEQITYSGHP